MLQERQNKGLSGWFVLVVLVAGVAATIAILANLSDDLQRPLVIIGLILLLVLDAFCWFGFTVVPPTTARVIVLLGDYKGSIKTPGFWWVNPLTARRLVSLKVRNFESG